MTTKIMEANDILAVKEWNCRGDLNEDALQQLMKSIQTEGQLQAVIVQPIEQCKWVTGEHTESYVLLAGFRRYEACRRLGLPVEAKIVNGYDHIKAKALNFTENLQRDDLTPTQEARVLHDFRRYGFTQAEIADYFGRSAAWVGDRLSLMELPEAVREARDKGEINVKQTRHLYKVRENGETVVAKLKEMREAHQRAERSTGSKVEKAEAAKAAGELPRTDINSKRHRTPNECTGMNIILLANGQKGLATRALAWAAGHITTHEFLSDLKEIDRFYIIPDKFDPDET